MKWIPAVFHMQITTALHVILLSAVCMNASAEAAGRKKPVQPPIAPEGFSGKKVILLKSVPNVRIEMPDQSQYDFGQDFQERMTTRLTNSNQFIVAHERPGVWAKDNTGADIALMSSGGPGWSGTYVPAASVQVRVDALSFTTGSRGERMFYGFNERLKTPFNDGTGNLSEEFPLRTVAFEPNWFDRTFDAKGKEPWGSRAGLDLGDGFHLEAVFAWLAVKYAQYHSQLNLQLEVRSPLSGRVELRKVQVSGRGYFYDVAGAYQEYSAGIRVARRDAMSQAFRNAIEGAEVAIRRSLEGLPLTARIDNLIPGQTSDSPPTLLLGTGLDAQIRLGTQYELVDSQGGSPPAGEEITLEVIQNVRDGAIAKLIHGNPRALQPGLLFRQTGFDRSASQSGSISASRSRHSGEVQRELEKIELPQVNFDLPKLGEGQSPSVSQIALALHRVLGTVILPYRIWRYYQYDQPYFKVARGTGSAQTSVKGARDLVETFQEPDAELSAAQSLLKDSRNDPWAGQIGLTEVMAHSNEHEEPGNREEKGPIVAIMDTGVDYNHPAIHSQLWLNPAPTMDSRGDQDRYGWDFTSGEGRPFDDAYHGTQLASAVLAVSPQAQIMPLKVFNPWGITRSASIYGAFQYAVDHGAKIILCGWATRKASRAIELGIQYAEQRGVLVVAAAGDRGDDLSRVPAYPASYANRYSNILAVTSVNSLDRLVEKSGRHANFDSGAGSDRRVIELAAPGENIRVAEPRNRQARETSTGIAAAFVAGAAARTARLQPPGRASATEIKAELFRTAERISTLESSVEGGLRLRVLE